MMKQILLNIKLTRQDMQRIMRQYRFAETDEEMLTSISSAVEPLLRPVCWYEETGEQRGCIVTLGPYVDDLEELYQKAGAMSEAYGLACIAMELLRKAYEGLSEQLQSECGRGIARYLFFGEHRPWEEMKELLESSGQKTVRCNPAGMLLPKKSVVFLAQLKAPGCGQAAELCDSCGNLSCMSRREGEGKN